MHGHIQRKTTIVQRQISFNMKNNEIKQIKKPKALLHLQTPVLDLISCQECKPSCHSIRLPSNWARDLAISPHPINRSRRSLLFGSSDRCLSHGAATHSLHFAVEPGKKPAVLIIGEPVVVKLEKGFLRLEDCN